MHIKRPLTSAIRWLAKLWKRMNNVGVRDLARFHRKPPVTTNVCRYRGAGDPPPLHWKACDPSTIRRFRALLTCPGGHIMTLRARTIESSGTVWPSVVCRSLGCGFHDFVRLIDWDLGRLSDQQLRGWRARH